MSEQTVIEAVRATLQSEMRRDDTVIVLGEDVGSRGGVFLATDGLIDEFGENRVIDMPLAESSICGVALGAAVNGMRPVAEIQFADFVWPAINQLVGEASKVRYGTNGVKTAPMTVRIPYGGGVRGGLYHSQSIEVLFSHTPGLSVVVPATPYDAKGLLATAIRTDDPVVVLEHKRTYRLVKGDVPDENYTIPIGKAEIKRHGTDMTIVTYGLTLHYSLQAAEVLAGEGVDVEVVDLRTVSPIDRETVLESIRKTSRALVVHEDNLSLGVGAEVSAIIAEHAFDSLDAPVMRVAGPDIPAMPFAPTLEAAYMPTADKIEAALRRLLEY